MKHYNFEADFDLTTQRIYISQGETKEEHNQVVIDISQAEALKEWLAAAIKKDQKKQEREQIEPCTTTRKI